MANGVVWHCGVVVKEGERRADEYEGKNRQEKSRRRKRGGLRKEDNEKMNGGHNGENKRKGETLGGKCWKKEKAGGGRIDNS